MTRHFKLLTMLLVSIAFPASSGFAQLNRGRPEEISTAGIDDRSGERLALEATFSDSSGRPVRLGTFFDGQRPVILSFNYTDCPLLCQLQLSGLVDGLRELSWTAGEEFRVVSVSIDPSETPQQAAAARQLHVRSYGRGDGGSGWTFLTGDSDAIAAATESAGFRYQFLPETQEFSHAAAAIVCTPNGRISRYLYGVQFDPQSLRLALTEAGEGQIGSAVDQLLLFCFRYDETSGEYTVAAWTIMRLAGLATVTLIGLFVLPAWLWSGRSPDDAADASTDAGPLAPSGGEEELP